MPPSLPSSSPSHQCCNAGAKRSRFACYSHRLCCVFQCNWYLVLFAKVAKPHQFQCISNSSCVEWVRRTLFFFIFFVCDREKIVKKFSRAFFFSSFSSSIIFFSSVSFVPSLADPPCPCPSIRRFWVALGTRFVSHRLEFLSTLVLFFFIAIVVSSACAQLSPCWAIAAVAAAIAATASQSKQRSTSDILLGCDTLNDTES